MTTTGTDITFRIIVVQMYQKFRHCIGKGREKNTGTYKKEI